MLIIILLVFLAGYAFSAWGVALLDSLVNTIVIFFQLIQGKMAVKITEDTVKATKLKAELENQQEESHACAIGFSIPVEEEEIYEDDE